MSGRTRTRTWKRRSPLLSSLFLVLLLLCCYSSALAPVSLLARAQEVDNEGEGGKETEGITFEEDLQDAIEQQEFREEVDTEVTSHIVEVAPEIDLTNGDGDVSTTKNCTVDIDVFCTDITPGKIQHKENTNKQTHTHTHALTKITSWTCCFLLLLANFFF